MRIRFRQSVAMAPPPDAEEPNARTYNAGQVADLPDDVAAGLIAGHLATPADDDETSRIALPVRRR